MKTQRFVFWSSPCIQEPENGRCLLVKAHLQMQTGSLGMGEELTPLSSEVEVLDFEPHNFPLGFVAVLTLTSCL